MTALTVDLIVVDARRTPGSSVLSSSTSTAISRPRKALFKRDSVWAFVVFALMGGSLLGVAFVF